MSGQLLVAPIFAQTEGVWTNVTPGNADLTNVLGCGNYGTYTIAGDPARPSDIYTHFDCQGMWKSTDYGLTWTGPINTGTDGACAGDMAGGIAIAPGSPDQPPILYAAGIRGCGLGFWRSNDGGVNWTNYPVTPANPHSGAQDMYWPSVDPTTATTC